MKSLRARLFAATLAALAITLGLTLAIGAVLTRRQVDRRFLFIDPFPNRRLPPFGAGIQEVALVGTSGPA